MPAFLSRAAGALVVLVAAVVGTSRTESAADTKPIRALLVIGGCCHDYAAQKDILKAGLEARVNLKIDFAYSADKTTSPALPIVYRPVWPGTSRWPASLLTIFPRVLGSMAALSWPAMGCVATKRPRRGCLATAASSASLVEPTSITV